MKEVSYTIIDANRYKELIESFTCVPYNTNNIDRFFRHTPSIPIIYTKYELPDLKI